jgi:serine phosphatase RsbU (regulator of sigma subunit)
MIQILLTYNFLQIQCLSPVFEVSVSYGLLKQLILPHSLIYYVALVVLMIFLIIAISVIQFRRIRRVLREKEEALKLIGIQKIELEFREKGITDSLVYAKRIQEALLPSELYFRKHFAESFIFFKPKDIVSGDFYWIGEKNERVFIVAADCTGHGVPGALLSMIGREIIEKTINEENIVAPSQVLAVLDKALEKTFSREKNVGTVIRDGMDLGLCVVDKRKRSLSFSGAFFPLYLIRNNNLTEFKGDRIVLGMNPEGSKYTDNDIELQDDDIFYIFSDGYIDQFGGLENKKYMYRRFRYLLMTIHSFPAETQKSILNDSIITWQGQNVQVDDMMVIGFKPLGLKV